MSDEVITTQQEQTEETKVSKKRNPVVKVLRFFMFLIVGVISVLLCGMIFSALHRKNVLEVLPKGFNAYVHTDSVWDAAEPLLDLQAADLALTGQEMADLRGLFMELRNSPLRNSAAVSFIAGRKADFALYDKDGDSYDFVAALDLSFMSLATRIGQYILPSIELVPEFTYNTATSYFEYEAAPDSKFYISFCRNLVLVSSSENLLRLALTVNNDSYTDEQRQTLAGKTSKAVKIAADSRTLAQKALKDNPALKDMIELIKEDTFSEVSFDITNEEIKISADIRLTENENPQTKLAALLSRDSQEADLLKRLTANVQYYTLISGFSLQELKDCAFENLPPDVDGEGLWSMGNSMSSFLFSKSLDDILFSWSGDEFAVLGLENQNDPVFAIQIRDEMQREIVFDSILSSIIMKSDSALILDGIRLPRITLPGFFLNILSLFDVNMPSPYYFVKDGYIFFSENPETLSSINTAAKQKKLLVKSENFSMFEDEFEDESSISLFYNLERSIPFFLRSNATLASALKLYSSGRFDISVKDSSLRINLQAFSNHALDTRKVPGFPVETGRSDGNLVQSYVNKKNAVYWVENGRTIKEMQLPSTKILEFTPPELESGEHIFVAPFNNGEKASSDGALWAVTTHGRIYLLNQELEVLPSFPVTAGEYLSFIPAAQKKTVIACNDRGYVCIVDSDGGLRAGSITLTGSLKDSPQVMDNILAFYDKGFTGGIRIFDIDGGFRELYTLRPQALGFGKPCLTKNGRNIMTAFICQNGTVNFWENDIFLEENTIKLEGIYHTNLVTDGKNYYALSTSGLLTKICPDGTVTSVSIPSIRKATSDIFLSVKDGIIYVCADSNLIYAFTTDMEIVYGYPVSGFGNPCLVDINGDDVRECFALSLDNRLHAWNLK